MRRVKGLIFLFLPLYFFSQVKELSLNQNWKFRKAGSKEWLPATVPGTVHTDLLANKKIPDPYTTKEKELAWVDTCDWEYRTFFSLDKSLLNEETDILFEGLDTYAKVYLNDSLVLRADNMFRSWSIKAKRFLKPGKNELRVYFSSAVKQGKDLAKQLPYTLPEGERVFTRKAQYHYGWDFAPRFVTCGIWKSVKLISWKSVRILNVGVSTDSISRSKALVYFRPEVNCAEKGNYEFVLSCKEHKGTNSILNTPIEPGTQGLDMMYIVMSPQLWWCNGMGEPFLYHFTLNLKKDGKTIDSKSFRVGIRDIELIREKDSIGQTFYFTLNGKPLFMKGANLVPPDVFLPQATKETQEQLVNLAVRGNMNMLRVWGGGVYRDDSFYDFCDENGLLVWQDLMFACAMYPGDKTFVDNVRGEVSEQAKRLSSHPCLALWCGNNEGDEGWKNWGWQKKFNYSFEESDEIYKNYQALFSKTIPAALTDSYQGEKYNYIPSSPQYGWGKSESMSLGDSHYWGVWWGMEPFEIYRKKIGRFMSEYGFQGFPSMEMLKQTCGDSLSLKSPCLKDLQKHPAGFETIRTYMERDYKVPTKIEDFVYVSQLLQARGTEIAIEAHRRSKPRCMGSLYWQFNDCWPGITWSSIDHAGVPKASWYAAKRAFKNILVSLIEAGDSIQVWITSDATEQDLRSVLYLNLCDLSGVPVWSRSIPVAVETGSSKKYSVIARQIPGDRKKEEMVLNASLNTRDGSIEPATSFYYFVSPKELSLQKPTVVVKMSGSNLELSTNTLAKNVFIDMGPGITFSDNFFDLLPGEKKIVQLKGKVSEDQKIRIFTLNDLVQP